MLPVAVLAFPTDFVVPVYLTLAQSFPAGVSFVTEALDLAVSGCSVETSCWALAQQRFALAVWTEPLQPSQAAFPSHSCSPGPVCPSVQTCLRHTS